MPLQGEAEGRRDVGHDFLTTFCFGDPHFGSGARVSLVLACSRARLQLSTNELHASSASFQLNDLGPHKLHQLLEVLCSSLFSDSQIALIPRAHANSLNVWDCLDEEAVDTVYIHDEHVQPPGSWGMTEDQSQMRQPAAFCAIAFHKMCR